MQNHSWIRTIAAASVALGLSAGAHAATDIKVTFTNVSPAGSVGTSPLWVGFHNSSFDLFDAGRGRQFGPARHAVRGHHADRPTGHAGGTAGVSG